MKNVQQILEDKFNQLEPTFQNVINEVWKNRENYIKWPEKALLLWSGCKRDKKYHKYPEDLKAKLKEKDITPNTLSNGPAISAFLFTGGERPLRNNERTQWSIHHIYDGQFPFEGRKKTLHAVKKGKHFTQSAGLIAVHPIADALCDEFFYFTWLLRKESYTRFGYDPDHIFAEDIDELGFES